MLADLIHHVRGDLTISQLSRIVHTYSANVHDPTLAAAIQTMCSKLLLNLIDPISHSKESAEAVKILQRIQIAFVSKMEAMAEVRDEWSKWSKVREPLPNVIATIQRREKERKEREKDEKEKEKLRNEVMDEDGDEVEGEKEGKKKDGEGEGEGEGGDAMEVDVVGGGGKEEETGAGFKDDPPLPELDDVDIERAKPMRKAMIMVDPGPDPIKGASRGCPPASSSLVG